MADAFPGGETEEWERTLLRSIIPSPIATVITDWRRPDNPIVAANPAFSALTGYGVEEILGRNCRFLGGPDTDPAAREELSAAVREGRPFLTELLNYKKDGTPFRNAVMIAPIRAPNGELALFLGSQMDVGADSRLPSPLRQRRAAELVGRLTPRQRQVLALMIRGYRNKQIAPELGIDEKTVKMHRSALLAKLGAGISADAVRIGVEAGLA